MQSPFSVKIIGHIHTDFSEKFGIPRQSGIADSLRGMIVFCPEYRNPDALRGIEDFSHLWLLWHFSQVPQNDWSPMVRPPRLGGNKKMGVFATRSPFRPNPIGLSCVKLDKVEQHPQFGTVVWVLGADLMDKTPILDIKPYLPHADCHPNAKGGFSSDVAEYALQVEIPETLLCTFPKEKQTALRQILAHDPRPSYHNDPNRIYGMSFAGYEIRFTVDGTTLTVCEIMPKQLQ